MPSNYIIYHEGTLQPDGTRRPPIKYYFVEISTGRKAELTEAEYKELLIIRHGKISDEVDKGSGHA